MRREVAATAAGMGRILAERRAKESERVDALYAQIKELGSQLDEAREESSIDPLTRLFNRKILDAMLDRAVDMRSVFGKETCLMMIDADHFKAVNDTHGHAAGDAVLKSLADCLTRSFPRKGDVAARYGGEEFALLLPDTDIHDCQRMAERLLTTVRSLRIEVEGKEIGVTISIGVTDVRAGDTIESWVQRADRALYRAKQTGRNRIVIT
jgi:diguanylate cyclase (GGDEF)-like protein